MAYADYRLCDVCGEKVFYDTSLNYDTHRDAPDRKPFRVAGKEPHPAALRLDRLGDWAVICHKCAETHRTAVVPLAPAPAAQEDAQDAIVMPAPTATGSIGVRLRKADRPPLQFESDASEDADAQDARRYRWLREHPETEDIWGRMGVELDMAVDAAAPATAFERELVDLHESTRQSAAAPAAQEDAQVCPQCGGFPCWCEYKQDAERQ